MRKEYVVVVAVLGLVGAVLAYQAASLRHIKQELTEIKALGNSSIGAQEYPAPPPASGVRGGAYDSYKRSEDQQWNRRLAALEESVGELGRATDYLVERGQLPLGTNKLEELQKKFLDASASDRDRLQALRMLRRNRGFTEEVAQFASGWLQNLTNSELKRDVLQQLQGATNPVLREPLLHMAAMDPNRGVREQAVENLSRFVTDPQVEARLWDTMKNDPSPDVREQAQDALLAGPLSDTRMAGLRQRALNPDSSIEERTTALRALQRGRADVSDIAASLAQAVQQTPDPLERVRIFRAFDNTSDPAFVPPLVQGLQDPNPVVREEAADALSHYRSDPTIQQWLRYLAENDVDPQVRREAFRALENRE
jgi:hypothetical protein